ncbi:hypothetical protein B0T17DRAFT_507086 [Bombardia bombarda]|uniref:Uncharacterized protein n=1 Tax=Bombardia bombarda TaxID=252184 RepID=A0AA39XBY6_9PEZI|nr:hypothetical protein B0T17DRAFT_507086 [Bombardia bombarda]
MDAVGADLTAQRANNKNKELSTKARAAIYAAKIAGVSQTQLARDFGNLLDRAQKLQSNKRIIWKGGSIDQIKAVKDNEADIGRMMQRLKAAWDAVEQYFIDHLIDSVPHRVAAVQTPVW